MHAGVFKNSASVRLYQIRRRLRNVTDYFIKPIAGRIPFHFRECDLGPQKKVRRLQVLRGLLPFPRLRQGGGRQSCHQRGASQDGADYLRTVHRGADTLRHRQGTDTAWYLDGHGQEQMERCHHQWSSRQREIHGMCPHPEDLHAGFPHQEDGEEHRASAELLRGTEPSCHHRPRHLRDGAERDCKA